ncbi:MAG: hypothetical protein LBT42_03575, partial [Tannerella sp.]|nr:hypothetical protein [Tannerella sp.]
IHDFPGSVIIRNEAIRRYTGRRIASQAYNDENVCGKKTGAPVLPLQLAGRKPDVRFCRIPFIRSCIFPPIFYRLPFSLPAPEY